MSNKYESQSTSDDNEQDSLGGKKIMPQGVYEATIDLAYEKASKSSKAEALSVRFKLNDGSFVDKDYWMVGADGNNYKVKNGKKVNTFGYNQVRALSRVAINAEIPVDSIATKVIKLFSFDTRKEEATEVQMMMGLIGAKVNIAVNHIKKNKGVKQTDGKYKDVGDLVELNEVNKVFSESGHTSSEILEKSPAEFIAAWTDKYAGKVINIFNPDLVVASATASNTPKTAPLFPT